MSMTSYLVLNNHIEPLRLYSYFSCLPAPPCRIREYAFPLQFSCETSLLRNTRSWKSSLTPYLYPNITIIYVLSIAPIWRWRYNFPYIEIIAAINKKIFTIGKSRSIMTMKQWALPTHLRSTDAFTWTLNDRSRVYAFEGSFRWMKDRCRMRPPM